MGLHFFIYFGNMKERAEGNIESLPIDQSQPLAVEVSGNVVYISLFTRPGKALAQGDSHKYQ